MSAQAANVISLGVTAVANTAANRRVTFGISGRYDAARHQFKGLIAFGIGLALTSGALAALHSASAQPGRGAEVAVLIAANLVAAVIRFALYRHWVFGAKHTAGHRRADLDDATRTEAGRPAPVEPFGPAAQVDQLSR